MAAFRAPARADERSPRRLRAAAGRATRTMSRSRAGTSFGLGCVLAGMDLGPGDEIVTSDSEHPGLLGPLIAARHRGATVRAVPFSELANAVGATTTLVAASHVNWITGEVAPPELAEVPVPVILDGAQGAGAIPVDVNALGCVAYAAAGQKWLCGADGTGMLWLDPEFGERVRTIAPSYGSFEDASRGLESTLRAGGRRFDSALSRESVAFSLAALEVLVAADFDAHGGASRRSRRPLRRRARRRRLHGGGARAQHAGRVRVPRPGRRARAARGGRDRRPRPARPPVPARRRSAPGTTSPTSSGCSPRCSERRSASTAARASAPIRSTSRRRERSRARSSRAGSGSSTAARRVGLMGALADTALEAGGEVVGVIPQQLVDREIAPPRPDRAARRQLDARAQGADGRARGRVRRAARRDRDARGADRGLHLEPARPARQAARRAQHRRLLRRARRVPRPRRRAGLPAARAARAELRRRRPTPRRCSPPGR